MRWTHFEGTHYEIGYQMGAWWAATMRRLEQSQCAKGQFRLHFARYRKYLLCDWHDSYFPLFRHTMKLFPECIDELEGMSRGAREGGFPATIPGLFALMLEEAPGTPSRCTALANEFASKAFVGHNEENERRFPLCFGEFRLHTKTEIKCFASVSYPFELCGGAVGMTPTFAFQNNSIGFARQQARLQQTWGARVPKCIIMRKLLEMETIDDVETLLSTHHVTIPYHQYLCFPGRVYSLRVRPCMFIKTSARVQLVMRRIERMDRHTNHFMFDGVTDEDWVWGFAGDQRWSHRRYEWLADKLRDPRYHSERGMVRALQEHAWNTAAKSYTNATLIFTAAGNGTSCHGWYYFRDRREEVERITLKLI